MMSSCPSLRSSASSRGVTRVLRRSLRHRNSARSLRGTASTTARLPAGQRGELSNGRRGTHCRVDGAIVTDCKCRHHGQRAMPERSSTYSRDVTSTQRDARVEQRCAWSERIVCGDGGDTDDFGGGP